MNGYRVLSTLLVLWMVGIGVLTGSHLEARERTPLRMAKTAVDAYHNVAIGNVGVIVTNYGRFGNADLNVDTFEWPIGSANMYLFEGRVWFQLLAPDLCAEPYASFEYVSIRRTRMVRHKGRGREAGVHGG